MHAPHKKITRNCKLCTKEFSVNLHRESIAKFCSRKCTDVYRGKTHSLQAHYKWKGGRPKCLGCQKVLSSYATKRCRSCFLLFNVGPNNPTFKAGYEGKLKLNRERAKTLRIIGFHTPIEWENLKKRWGFMCLCCKKKEPEVKLTRDHIMPISLGGDDSIQNIQPLCLRCNIRKYTFTIDFQLFELQASFQKT